MFIFCQKAFSNGLLCVRLRIIDAHCICICHRLRPIKIHIKHICHHVCVRYQWLEIGVICFFVNTVRSALMPSTVVRKSLQVQESYDAGVAFIRIWLAKVFFFEWLFRTKPSLPFLNPFVKKLVSLHLSCPVYAFRPAFFSVNNLQIKVVSVTVEKSAALKMLYIYYCTACCQVWKTNFRKFEEGPLQSAILNIF